MNHLGAMATATVYNGAGRLNPLGGGWVARLICSWAIEEHMHKLLLQPGYIGFPDGCIFEVGQEGGLRTPPPFITVAK